MNRGNGPPPGTFAYSPHPPPSPTTPSTGPVLLDFDNPRFGGGGGSSAGFGSPPPAFSGGTPGGSSMAMGPNRRGMLADALGGPQQAASSIPSGATAPSPGPGPGPGFGGLGMGMGMGMGAPQSMGVGAPPSSPMMAQQLMGRQLQMPSYGMRSQRLPTGGF
jgi:hypothetical protein